MVGSGKSISARAIAGMRGQSQSVDGEGQSSQVQGGVSSRADGDSSSVRQAGSVAGSLNSFFGHVGRILRGRYERNSGVPVAPPVGLTKRASLMDIVLEQRAQLRREFSLYAREHGLETFEEADDFDIPDDPIDPRTPWENDFEPSVDQLSGLDDQALAVLRKRANQEADRRKSKAAQQTPAEIKQPVASPAAGMPEPPKPV